MNQQPKDLIGKIFTMLPEGNQYEILEVKPLDKLKTLYAISYHQATQVEDGKKFLLLKWDDLAKFMNNDEVCYTPVQLESQLPSIVLGTEIPSIINSLKGNQIEICKDGIYKNLIAIGDVFYKDGIYNFYASDEFYFLLRKNEENAIAKIGERDIDAFCKGEKISYRALEHDYTYQLIKIATP